MSVELVIALVDEVEVAILVLGIKSCWYVSKAGVEIMEILR